MAELQDFKCPSCGGAIHFDTGVQKMKCPYCDAEFDIDSLKGIKINVLQASDIVRLLEVQIK